MEELNVGVIGGRVPRVVTAACLAHVGYRITLVDVDARRVESLGRGQVPIYEPGLTEFASRLLSAAVEVN